MTKLFCKIFTVLLLCFLNVVCMAATIDWKGGTSTSWSNAANWSGGVLPGSGDAVRIGVVSFTNQPTLDVTTTIASLTFGAPVNPTTLTITSGLTLTVTGNITQQHSANNTSVTTNISQTVVGGIGGTINCSGSFLVGDATVPPTPVIGILNAQITNLTTFNLSLQNFTISQNCTLNTTSASGTVGAFTSSNVNNPVVNFNNGAVSIGQTLQMTNSAYVNTPGYTIIVLTYPAVKNAAVFTVNPASNVTAGTTENLAFAGATPLNINPDGNAAGTLDFNGGGSGTSTVSYTGASAQTVYTATTGLDASPATYQNISFSGGGTKTVQAGTLTISGNWSSVSGMVDLVTNSCTTTFSATSPTITDFGSNGGAGVVFNNLTLNNSSATLSSTGKFAIGSQGILTLSGTSNLATNNNLTLNSDATGSASVAAITSGAITGKVNVQRYVEGNNNINYRGYRTLSSPVNTSGFISLDYIANSTIVTGATTTAGGAVGGNPTIYLYNESLPVNNTSFVSGNFVGVTNTTSTTIGTLSGTTASTTTLPVGNGYFVYFRGDNIHTTNKTTAPFASPENVTFTATGTLNQGTITVNDWYTTNLSYTSSQAAIAKGFNLVGNPYASSIDWDKLGTAITATNTDNTVYIYNVVHKTYCSYIAGMGGIPGSNWPNTSVHNANIIPSGQGFFVHATAASPSLIFTESAKTSSQQATTSNLILASRAAMQVTDPPYFRIQLKLDSVNDEDVLVLFNPNASAKYVVNEDAVYLKGSNSVSLSLASADNVALAIDQLPLPQTSQIVGLNVRTTSAGTYQINLTELKNIPDMYDIWLMDNYMKDSLDIKHNPTYTFNISADTNSSSLNRFKLVIRANALLAYRLLNFAGNKTTGGDQLQWTTENEHNNTTFIVQRSTDDGTSFSDLATIKSTGAGNYGFMDNNPAPADWYRLKQIDLNGNITYSVVVGIQYADLSSNSIGNKLSVYPNPTADVVNMSVTSNGSAVTGNYNIIICNGLGSVIKNVSSAQSSWHGNVSSFSPGIYVVKVIDKNSNTVIGTGKFIKL